MHRHKKVTRDVWRAVVVAGAMLAPGCSSSPRPVPAPPAATEPAGAETGTEAVQPEAAGGGAPTEAAAGMAEMKAPPPPPDAGVPDASPPPDARPRKRDGKPKGRGFLLA